MLALRSLAMSVALLAPSLALSAPITFVLDHGSVTARVEVNGTIVANTAASLDSGFVVFDPSSGALPDFALGSTTLLFSIPALPGAYNALDLDILLTPGVGYSNSATGSNPWAVTLGPIRIDFAGSAIDATYPVTVPAIPISGAVAIPSFSVDAYYDAGEMRLGLLGVKVGEINWNGVLFEVRADIEFIGFAAVPEPAGAGLALFALVGLAAVARRR